MLNVLIAHIAKINGLPEPTAKTALGIVLNSAERQASPFAPAMFKAIPGARALAARTGSEFGAATGIVARLIEQTPGGKRVVAQTMIGSLHTIGLDHKAIGHLLPSISTFMEEKFEMIGFGHLGDLIGHDMDAQVSAAKAA